MPSVPSVQPPPCNLCMPLGGNPCNLCKSVPRPVRERHTIRANAPCDMLCDPCYVWGLVGSIGHASSRKPRGGDSVSRFHHLTRPNRVLARSVTREAFARLQQAAGGGPERAGTSLRRTALAESERRNLIEIATRKRLGDMAPLAGLFFGGAAAVIHRLEPAECECECECGCRGGRWF